MASTPYFKGTLVGSPLVNSSESATFGTHYAYLGIGGYIQVDSIADRNSIPVDSTKGIEFDKASNGRRTYGMTVYVIQEDKYYELKPSLTAWNAANTAAKVALLADNNNWIESGVSINGGQGITIANNTVNLGGSINQQVNLNLQTAGGLTITDNRTTPKGIEYDRDLSSYFTSNSLITKAYADSIQSGLKSKEAVDVTSVSNIDIAAATIPQVIDDYTLNNGDRILIKNQTNKVENGIYVYTVSGSTASFSRSDDFNSNDEVRNGSYVFTLNGTENKNTGWIVVTLDPIVVNTDIIEWRLFSRLMDFEGGPGIKVTLTSGLNNISLKYTNPFTTSTANGLELKIADPLSVDSVSGNLNVKLAYPLALENGSIGISRGDGLTVTNLNQLAVNVNPAQFYFNNGVLNSCATSGGGSCADVLNFIHIEGSRTLDGSEHVIGINSNCIGTVLTLPTAPAHGKTYIFKDDAGVADSNNITICAPSKQIDDVDCALINTPFGALHIIYSCTKNKWFSLSYV